MNITIILPAVHVTSKRQRDDSPQPTTPFPPISITPSPTPFSEMSSYNPDDYKDIIDEYNREVAENHLSKSRAEIVARQAAYDDIQITRSAPGTLAGTTRGSIASTPPAPVAPCPYCASTDSKSETSLRSVADRVVRNNNSGGDPANPSRLDRRSLVETSLSTDRTTESPSSVDTVNTVIQGKAYDVLGELKHDHLDDVNFDHINDSFDSLGNDFKDGLYQEEDELEEAEEEIVKTSEIVTTTSNTENSTTTTTTTTVTTTETTKLAFLTDHDLMPEGRRNLDFLYEAQEEDDDDDVDNEVDHSFFTYDESMDQAIINDKTTRRRDSLEEELFGDSNNNQWQDMMQDDSLLQLDESLLLPKDEPFGLPDESNLETELPPPQQVEVQEEPILQSDEAPLLADVPPPSDEPHLPPPASDAPALPTSEVVEETSAATEDLPELPKAHLLTNGELILEETIPEVQDQPPQENQELPSPVLQDRAVTPEEPVTVKEETTVEKEVKVPPAPVEEPKTEDDNHEEGAPAKEEIIAQQTVSDSTSMKKSEEPRLALSDAPSEGTERGVSGQVETAPEEQQPELGQIEDAPAEKKENKSTPEPDTDTAQELPAVAAEASKEPEVVTIITGKEETEPNRQEDNEEEATEAEEVVHNEDNKEPEEDNKVPGPVETGNEDVTIIITQDEMPPANLFDSDDGSETEDNGNADLPDLSQDKMSENTSDKGEPETEAPVQAQDIPPTSSTPDLFEEEDIAEIIRENVIRRNSFNKYSSEGQPESSHFEEQVDDRFSRLYGKRYDVSEQSFKASDKTCHFEQDFETESGFEEFDRSFQETSHNLGRRHSHFDNHSDHHCRKEELGTIHRQNTLADIPLFPQGRKSYLVKKQKTEDFSATTVPLLMLKKKGKPYPDPRKPAVYPQRLNKTTLARQALAREKRRIYVEERIQNFMRNTKSIQTPFGSLDRSYSIDRQNHKIISNTSFSSSKTSSDSRKYDKVTTHMSTTSSSSRPNFESLTNFRKSKMESPQSLPDISIIDYYMSPSRGLLTSTPVSSSMGKIPSHKSHLSSSMSSIQSPTIGIAEVSVVSGSGMGGGANTNNNNTSTSSTGGGGLGSSAATTSKRRGIVIDSIPEETSDFWKAISSEDGYFYTFRVRQTGPVQMVDKAVQTQTGPMNFSKEYYTPFPRKRAPPLNDKSSTIILPLIDDRDKILREIAETVQLRHDAELRRAELIQRANDLQTLIKEKRDKINRRHEFWHKKYIEETSITRPLEAACNSLRAELNTVHRRLLAHLEGRDLPLRLRDGPSKKANYKIMAARLQHEIKELQQKAKSAKLRLESEVKLKEQAEREVRELRNDLSHKKVIMSLARSQIAALPSVHPRGYDPLGY